MEIKPKSLILKKFSCPKSTWWKEHFFLCSWLRRWENPIICGIFFDLYSRSFSEKDERMEKNEIIHFSLHLRNDFFYKKKKLKFCSFEFSWLEKILTLSKENFLTKNFEKKLRKKHWRKNLRKNCEKKINGKKLSFCLDS